MPANKVTRNVDAGQIALGAPTFRTELLSFAAQDTFVKGTILARKLISDAITETPDPGNTGTFVLSAAAQPGKNLKVGTYVLTAGTLAAGVGEWTLVDPDGTPETFTTQAATDALVFEELGITVTVTDPGAGTAFVTADTADLVVAAAANSPLVPYSPTGTNGAQVPIAVLTYDVARTTAGNESIRALIEGRVNASRLVIDEDGDGSNITKAILDELKASSIVAVDVNQLAQLDNPSS